MSIEQELIRYIQDNLIESGDSVSADDPLIDLGLLDSVGLMQIIQFVESQAGVRIPDTDVVPDNFHSVATIGALVTRIRAS